MEICTVNVSCSKPTGPRFEHRGKSVDIALCIYITLPPSNLQVDIGEVNGNTKEFSFIRG
jgi:hypothetical protein